MNLAVASCVTPGLWDGRVKAALAEVGLVGGELARPQVAPLAAHFPPAGKYGREGGVYFQLNKEKQSSAIIDLNMFGLTYFAGIDCICYFMLLLWPCHHTLCCMLYVVCMLLFKTSLTIF